MTEAGGKTHMPWPSGSCLPPWDQGFWGGEHVEEGTGFEREA